jgi:hypothetical protein
MARKAEANLNKSLKELAGQPQLDKQEGAYYEYTPVERDLVQTLFWRFRDAQQERDRVFEYFDRRTLIEYINDSVLRFVTNIDQREDIEDWQSRVHAPFTRNKILTMLGKVLDEMPVVDIKGRGDQDLLKAEIVNTLYEYADDVDDAQEFFVYALEEALVKGTMIGYEGIDTYTRSTRNVVKYKDGDDIQVQEGKIIERRLVSKIVPLEEFYPSSVSIRKLDDMPYCFWRREIPYTRFAKEYKNFDKAKFVSPYSANKLNQNAPKPYYANYVSPTTRDGMVEIINYYNQDTDEYVILANGIWLNPIGNEIVSPLPFNHKKLPFFSFIYDIFGSDFFYGKSLADRLKSLQDVMNVLQNMMLDQSFLSIFSPILLAGSDDIEDDFLRPGRRIPIDTNGLPINQVFQKLDLSTSPGWHEFILNYTKGVLEESSTDRLQQGQAPTEGRVTATAIKAAAMGLEALLGLFEKFIKNGLKRRARLRVANILQFYTDPDYPITEAIGGADFSKSMAKAFNVFTVDSLPMTPGERGTKIIELYRSTEDLPTQGTLQMKTRLQEISAGKRLTRIAVTPDYIRQFEFDISLVPNKDSDMNQAEDRALEIQFQQTMLQMYPDLIDREQLASELIVTFGKDPAKVLKDTHQQNQQRQQNPQNPMQAGQAPPQGGQPSPGIGGGQAGPNAGNIIANATGATPNINGGSANQSSIQPGK